MSDGVLVGSGSFRVDRDAALKKLSSFQVSDTDLLTPWVRCAEAVGAARLELSVDRLKVRVLMDGTPFAGLDLSDPYYALFSGEEAPKAVTYLAAGLLSLSRLAPKRLRLSSGDGKEWRTFQGKDARSLTEFATGLPVSGTALEADFGLPGREALEAAVDGLRGRVMMGKALVFVNGARFGPEAPRGAAYVLAGLRSQVAPSRQPERDKSPVRLVIDGVAAQTLEHPGPWGPVDAVLTGDSLALDASLGRVVVGPEVQAALKALHEKMQGFVNSMTKVQLREGQQTRRLLMDGAMREVWDGSTEFRGRDAAITREALERTRWLREACWRVINGPERADSDTTSKVLRNAPLFLDAAGGWLSWEGLAAVSRQFKKVFFSRRRAIGFSLPLPGGRTLFVRGSQVVWVAGKRDAADLRRLADRGEVVELA